MHLLRRHLRPRAKLARLVPTHIENTFKNTLALNNLSEQDVDALKARGELGAHTRRAGSWLSNSQRPSCAGSCCTSSPTTDAFILPSPPSPPPPSPPLPPVQIHELLQFFSVKRDVFVSEIEAIFRDFREERLGDDMYSRDDVESLLSDLREATRDRVRRDQETTATMAGLVLEQILAAAAEAGAGAVSIDLSRTEDAASLERIRALNTVFFAEEGGRAGGGPRSGAKLDSLRDEHGRLVAERDRLQEESSALRERQATMQAQCTSLLREKSDLAARVQSLEAEAAALRSGAGAAAAARSGTEAEVSSLRAQVTELSGRLESSKVSERGGMIWGGECVCVVSLTHAGDATDTHACRRRAASHSSVLSRSSFPSRRPSHYSPRAHTLCSPPPHSPRRPSSRRRARSSRRGCPRANSSCSSRDSCRRRTRSWQT